MITQIQKGKNYFYQISLTMLVAMISIVGCKKNEPVGPTPVIIDFNATSGWAGDVVRIQGSNFDAIAANNIVKFGDKVAVVNAVSNDFLTYTNGRVTGGQLGGTTPAALLVVVPAGATTGKINVTVNGVTGTTTTDFTINTETVYICGHIYKNGRGIAGYWKNNVFVSLTDGTRSAIANGMVVVGNDVYVVGAEASTTTSVAVAKYWKNGVSVNLSGVQNANATGIAVVGNDVYVAGTEIGSTLKYVARYWKNGVLTILSDGVKDELTGNIVVSGNDVYVVCTSLYNERARYWKNGVAVDVVVMPTPGVSGAYLTSIAVLGGDVYVGGSYATGNGYNATYWKNGVRTSLMTGGRIASVVINNGAVHMAVSTSQGATYYKNDVSTKLEGAEFAEAISVIGSDVYIAGVATTTYSAASTIYSPRYWKNGVGINLGNGVDDARATGIVVIP